MLKKRNLVICPVCLEQQKTHILGEVAPNGDFLIQRDRNTIRIRALHLQVICNQCGEVVFIRHAPAAVPRQALYQALFGGSNL
jgi:hypothetical protein